MRNALYWYPCYWWGTQNRDSLNKLPKVTQVTKDHSLSSQAFCHTPCSMSPIHKDHPPLFFFLLFRATPAVYGSSLARGRIRVASCWPTPEPQQHGIWAPSVTYTTVHSSTRSLTHWMRPGIKPASSQTLCRVLNPLSHNRNSPKQHFYKIGKD